MPVWRKPGLPCWPDSTKGTVAYERLVAAAAECVAVAAGGPDDGARSRLQEAADRLHGLAAGLSEAQSIGRTSH